MGRYGILAAGECAVLHLSISFPQHLFMDFWKSTPLFSNERNCVLSEDKLLQLVIDGVSSLP
jgi:hypothetical protein